MKFKPLTEEQLILSLDRLTRFKPAKEKYMRVFGEIILANITEPRYKKSDLYNLTAQEIRDMAVEVINASCGLDVSDYSINNIIMNYENSIYNNDTDTRVLLDNNINYTKLIKLISHENKTNLKWLSTIDIYNNTCEAREKYSLNYPVEKVLLVEGLTEELLLPAFSAYLGYDFDKKGIQLIPAGGKNQVVKMYYRLADELKIPIFLLLDKDAEENISQIKPRLRDIDKIHLVSCGEFEDLLPKSLIIKTVNQELNNFAAISEEDLSDDLSEAKNLEYIFKEKGLHDFKKADFARLVKENINTENDVSDEIREIISELISL